MRRFFPFTLAASLATLAVGLIAYQWLEQPTTLRVAVGPLGSEDTRLVTAMAQYLGREHATVRLKLVITEGVMESARAVEAGKAEIAVVRSDAAMPARAQTVAILHRDAVVLMAPHGSPIGRVNDLAGRRVGILRASGINTRLLGTILSHYGVEPDTVVTVPLASGGEAEDALKGGRIDALMAFGTLTGRTVTEAVTAMAASGPPVFVPVSEANALAQRSPAFETIEAVRGVFGGTPSRPADTLTTLGVTHRLVAEAKTDDQTVSELTRLLFTMRPSIAGEVPLAQRIEAPDTSKSASLPVHPGAAAYYEGEVQTFFERYGDWFYLVVMALSIAGSAAAGLVTRAANRNRSRDMDLLRELLAIVREAHGAEDEGLDALEKRADEILAAALARAGGGGIDNAGVAAFTLGLDQARRAIAERRRTLREAPPYPALPRAAE